jgi:hypothetical protein
MTSSSKPTHYKRAPFIGLLARVVESTSSRITSFAAVLLPSGRLALSLDCSESENIQHAIGADGNPLVSVHAEGDRV